MSFSSAFTSMPDSSPFQNNNRFPTFTPFGNQNNNNVVQPLNTITPFNHTNTFNLNNNENEQNNNSVPTTTTRFITAGNTANGRPAFTRNQQANNPFNNNNNNNNINDLPNNTNLNFTIDNDEAPITAMQPYVNTNNSNNNSNNSGSASNIFSSYKEHSKSLDVKNSSYLTKEHYNMVMNIMRFICKMSGEPNTILASRHTAAYIFNTFIAPAINSSTLYSLTAEQEGSIQFNKHELAKFFKLYDVHTVMLPSSNSKFPTLSLRNVNEHSNNNVIPIHNHQHNSNDNISCSSSSSSSVVSNQTLQQQHQHNNNNNNNNVHSILNDDDNITISRAQFECMLQAATNTSNILRTNSNIMNAAQTTVPTLTPAKRSYKRNVTSTNKQTSNKKTKVDPTPNSELQSHSKSSKSSEFMPVPADRVKRPWSRRARRVISSPSPSLSPDLVPRKKQKLSTASDNDLSDSENKYDTEHNHNKSTNIIIDLDDDSENDNDNDDNHDDIRVNDAFKLNKDQVTLLHAQLSSLSKDNIPNIFQQLVTNEPLGNFKTVNDKIKRLVDFARESRINYNSLNKILNQ